MNVGLTKYTSKKQRIRLEQILLYALHISMVRIALYVSMLQALPQLILFLCTSQVIKFVQYSYYI